MQEGEKHIVSSASCDGNMHVLSQKSICVNRWKATVQQALGPSRCLTGAATAAAVPLVQ